MALRPYGDYIICKPVDKTTEERLSGIVLPATAEEMKQRGEIVQLPESIDDLEVGDHIIFASHAGFYFFHEGLRLGAFRQEDVLAIVVDSKAKVILPA